MLGILVILIVSWVLLHFIEKKNITVLGIVPNQKHLFQFLIGFFFIVLINLSMIYIESMVKSVEWKMRGSINYVLIFKSFIYHFKSALTEDLVFRGAILYILIQRIGKWKSIIFSAMAFGIYHWFSYGIFGGSIIFMTYVFLITGFTGYVWAYTFEKTKSIMMPLGLHLGYNLIMSLFYTSQPYGELMFTEISRVDLSGWNDVSYSFLSGFYPSIITLVFVKLLLRLNIMTYQKD